MAQTTIEWTATYKEDRTVLPGFSFNPWIGCTRVSPGCQHCYAETLMADRYKKVKWGPQGQRRRTSADYWKQPLKWNRQAAKDGIRRRVFCASLSDLFEVKEDQYDEMESWRHDLFSLIDMTPHLDWLILTKRPHVARVMVPARWLQGWPPNVWIGTSVEDQQRADERIPELLKIPAVVRFLSVEPMLGPVDLSRWLLPVDEHESHGILVGDSPIHWVIVGGESGHGARPMHPDWARSIRDQCQAAGVSFFFKQWGAWAEYQANGPLPPECSFVSINGAILVGDSDNDTDACMGLVGKHRAGRLLDGREWNEFPADGYAPGQAGEWGRIGE